MAGLKNAYANKYGTSLNLYPHEGASWKVMEFSIDTRTQFERHASKITQVNSRQGQYTPCTDFRTLQRRNDSVHRLRIIGSNVLSVNLRIEEEFRFVGFDQQKLRQALRAVSRQSAFFQPLVRLRDSAAYQSRDTTKQLRDPSH